jgi:hypothetical protein
MHLDAGSWILVAAPAVLGFGVWPTAAAGLALVVVSLTTNAVFSLEERRELAACVRGSLLAAVPFGKRRQAISS